MTHLILHKVRGEPAFDIAHKIQIGNEEGWIIPTSGHRAYPYWSKPLSDYEHLMLEKLLPPEGTPDHYSVNDKAEQQAKLNFPNSKPPHRNLTLDDLD